MFGQVEAHSPRYKAQSFSARTVQVYTVRRLVVCTDGHDHPPPNRFLMPDVEYFLPLQPFLCTPVLHPPVRNSHALTDRLGVTSASMSFPPDGAQAKKGPTAIPEQLSGDLARVIKHCFHISLHRSRKDARMLSTESRRSYARRVESCKLLFMNDSSRAEPNGLVEAVPSITFR